MEYKVLNNYQFFFRRTEERLNRIKRRFLYNEDSDKVGSTEGELFELEVSDKFIIAPIKLFPLINKRLNGELGKIKMKVKWSDQEPFSLREYQTDIVEKILKEPYGIVSLPTGWGKSMLMVYMFYRFIWENEGLVLFTAPNLSVLDEIKSRMNFGDSERAIFIQPPGFCNSEKFDDPEWKEKLKEVRLVLADETESIPESTIKLLRDRATKCYRHYGFSGSADKAEGKEITYSKILSPAAFELLCQYGPSIVHIPPKKDIELYVGCGRNKGPYSRTSYPRQVQKAVRSYPFLEFFNLCISMTDQILYFPVITKDDGWWIWDRLEVPTAFWATDGVHYNFDTEENLKDLCEAGKIKVLIGTSLTFRGIDIHQITSSLLTFGSQFAAPSQIIGRSFRYKGVPKVFLWEVNNLPMYHSSYKKRLKIIKTKQQVIKYKRLGGFQ